MTQRSDRRLVDVNDSPGSRNCIDTRTAVNRRAIHQVHPILAVRAIAPQDVRVTVTVVVAIAGNMPCRRDRVDAHTAGNRRAIHQVHPILAVRAIAPQDVRVTVTVIVPVAGNMPRS